MYPLWYIIIVNIYYIPKKSLLFLSFFIILFSYWCYYISENNEEINTIQYNFLYNSSILLKKCEELNIECIDNDNNDSNSCFKNISSNNTNIINNIIDQLINNELLENITVTTAKNFNINKCILFYKKNETIDILINPVFLDNPKFLNNGNVIILNEMKNIRYCKKDIYKEITKIFYKQSKFIYFNNSLGKNMHYDINYNNNHDYKEVHENLKFLYGHNICVNFNSYFKL